MILRKIQSLSFVKQGALNGFLLGTLIQLIFIRQIYGEISYYLFPDPRCHGFGCPNVAKMIDHSGLFYISLLFCLIVMLSYFIFQKLFAVKIKSQIVSWAIIAFFSTIFLYICGSVYGFIHEYLRECWWVRYESCNNVDFVTYLQITQVEIVQSLITFSIFLAFNLLFAFVINCKKSILP